LDNTTVSHSTPAESTDIHPNKVLEVEHLLEPQVVLVQEFEQ